MLKTENSLTKELAHKKGTVSPTNSNVLKKEPLPTTLVSLQLHLITFLRTLHPFLCSIQLAIVVYASNEAEASYKYQGQERAEENGAKSVPTTLALLKGPSSMQINRRAATVPTQWRSL